MEASVRINIHLTISIAICLNIIATKPRKEVVLVFICHSCKKLNILAFRNYFLIIIYFKRCAY